MWEHCKCCSHCNKGVVNEGWIVYYWLSRGYKVLIRTWRHCVTFLQSSTSTWHDGWTVSCVKRDAPSHSHTQRCKCSTFHRLNTLTLLKTFYHTSMPSKLVADMVKSQVYIGHHQLNPLNFHHYDIYSGVY